ncbi:hypothetical protein D516_2957 [Rhodobacter sp. AKP1]|nr:hypothetical protein D516_2957 [Rhodobacter sp. AKP1]
MSVVFRGCGPHEDLAVPRPDPGQKRRGEGAWLCLGQVDRGERPGVPGQDQRGMPGGRPVSLDRADPQGPGAEAALQEAAIQAKSLPVRLGRYHDLVPDIIGCAAMGEAEDAAVAPAQNLALAEEGLGHHAEVEARGGGFRQGRACHEEGQDRSREESSWAVLSDAHEMPHLNLTGNTEKKAAGVEAGRRSEDGCRPMGLRAMAGGVRRCPENRSCVRRAVRHGCRTGPGP